MLRVESSDYLSFTEFEEDILFDEDDPDFAKQQDVMPSIPLPLVLRVPTKMSLAGVHPAEVHATHGGMDDMWPEPGTGANAGTNAGANAMLTIEELRLQLSSCFTCGVSWLDRHVSLDCAECGGYALERPCPSCDGHCDNTWKRDLTMTHASGKARWEGECTYGTCSCPRPPPPPPAPSQQQQPQPIEKAPSNHSTKLAQELCTRLEKLSATS